MRSSAALWVPLFLASASVWAQAPKPEDPDAAAMERAQRQADSPLRAILQASKFRRKTGAGADTAPEPPELIRPRSMPDAAPPAELDLVASGGLAAPLHVETAGLSPVKTVAPPAVASLVSPAAAALAVWPVQPRLLDMIEPAIPRRLMDLLSRPLEVNVDVSIRADGTVADANVASSAPHEFRRYIIEAVLKWRYAPLPAPQVQRVQVVFKPS